MDDEIIAALAEIRERRGQIYSAAAEKHREKPDEWRDQLINHELAEHLNEALRSANLVPDYNQTMIRNGIGGAVGLQFSAPSALLRWNEAIGPKRAIRRLRNLLKKPSAVGFQVVALSGIDVDTTIALSPRLRLVPFKALPDSPQKNRVWQRQFNLDIGIFRPPSCALMATTTVKPLLYSTPEQFQSSTEEYSSTLEMLEISRYCISLLNPFAPLRLSGWFQFKDELLNELSMAGAASQPSMPQHSFREIPSLGPFNPVQLRRILSGFSKLTSHDREKVRRSLDRYLAARCQPSPGDAAIDLSIALESLVGDTGSPGEHTWKIGLRAALLAAEDLPSRNEIRSTVKNVYGIRSAVMHDGVVSKKHLNQANQVVLDGMAHWARIISSVILRSKIPQNWSEFELSDGHY